MTAKLTITARIQPDGSALTLKGRDAWALCELLKAGQRGWTAIDHPGPRWSGYVFNLKSKYGFAIETVHENHGGQFAGNHARYILRTLVEIIGRSDEPERGAA